MLYGGCSQNKMNAEVIKRMNKSFRFLIEPVNPLISFINSDWGREQYGMLKRKWFYKVPEQENLLCTAKPISDLSIHVF